MKKLKVAVVGCGLIAKARHIPGYKRMKKSVDLCAVCDLNEKIAKETARDCHIPQAYSNVSEMLSKEDLDIVDICVPPQVHAPVAVEAMENGCQVLMEKPMALKTSDCDRMIDASRKHKVKLCIIHNELFHPPVLKARKLVATGFIGDFIGMRIFRSTPFDDMMSLKDHWIHKLPGGVIGETGPHMAYMSLAFLNNIRNVDIYAKNFLEHLWAPFDEFRIDLEGKNGFSSILLSYTHDWWAADMDILGTKAALHLDLNNMLLTRHRLKELSYIPIARSSLSTISQMVGGIASNVFKVVTDRQKIGTDIVIERFVASVLNDSQPPVTGEEGRETVRVMEMVVKKYREKYED
jgi:predicted dehydrogenase